MGGCLFLVVEEELPLFFLEGLLPIYCYYIIDVLPIQMCCVQTRWLTSITHQTSSCSNNKFHNNTKRSRVGSSYSGYVIHYGNINLIIFITNTQNLIILLWVGIKGRQFTFFLYSYFLFLFLLRYCGWSKTKKKKKKRIQTFKTKTYTHTY